MCIMFYTTKKIGLPTDDTLDLIFESNPHGGGMAFVYHDKTTNKLMIGHEKGLMTKKLFVERVKSNFTFLTNDDDYMVAHTRIATSGGQSASKTHPFETVKGGYLFHNGIAPTAVLNQIEDHTISDTEYLASIYEGIEWLKKTDPSSRYFVINPDGSFNVCGSWEKDKEGRLWSNGGYRHRTYSSGYYGYSRGGYGGSYYEDEGCGWRGNAYGTVNTGEKSRKTTNDSYDNALFEVLKIRYSSDAIASMDETLREMAISYYIYSDIWYVGGDAAKVSPSNNLHDAFAVDFKLPKPKVIIGARNTFYPNYKSKEKDGYIHRIRTNRRFASDVLGLHPSSGIRASLGKGKKPQIALFVENTKKKTKTFLGYVYKKDITIYRDLAEMGLEVVENAIASDDNITNLPTLLIRNKAPELPKPVQTPVPVATTSMSVPMTVAEQRMRVRLEQDVNNIILDDSTLTVDSLYYTEDASATWANVILKKDSSRVSVNATTTYQKVVYAKLSLIQDNTETEIVDALYDACLVYLKEKGVKMYEYI